MAKRNSATAVKRVAKNEDTASGSFSGIPTAAFTFFKNLATNNNREWFLAHKSEYESQCHSAFKALTIALRPPSGAEKISRIYRDVRFSKDKSPYHTHVSAVLDGFYLQLNAEGLYVGTGLYMPEPPVLGRLRSAIDDESSGMELVNLVATLRQRGHTVESHESVASAPRGFSADHPRIELLRMKDIHAGKRLDPKSLSSANTIATVHNTHDTLSLSD